MFRCLRASAPVLILAALAACDILDPDDPPRPTREVALSVAYLHACALDVEGVAYCWGGNNSGQLGTGDTAQRPEPTPVSGDHRFVAISAGGSTTCALSAEDGAAYCWGLNEHGQLGDGSLTNRTVPDRVTGELAFEEIHVGYRFVCARTAEGAAYCWGRNDVGQVGSQVTGLVATPTRVAGNVVFESLTAGLVQACGLTPGGEAFCWGGGQFGALGTGTTEHQFAPVPVAGGHRFSHLGTGATTTCGIAVGGGTMCWGLNYYGSLAMGEVEGGIMVREPAAITGDPGFLTVTPGAENNVFTPGCGLTAGGAAYCWGSNAYGVLASSEPTAECILTGEPFTCTGVPVAVEGGHRFSVIRPSGDFVCGITTEGALYCWGSNHQGQLGSPAATETCQPVAEERPCSTVPIPVGGGLRLP